MLKPSVKITGLGMLFILLVASCSPISTSTPAASSATSSPEVPASTFAIPSATISPSPTATNLPTEPNPEDCVLDPASSYNQTITALVDGDPLELRVSGRFAGAIDSLTWRGKEFINDWDHGREIGYAWGMNDVGECLNPTEPGSANDGRGPVSTSRWIKSCSLSESSLFTSAQAAYWFTLGQPDYCAGKVNTDVPSLILSDHIIDKTVEIGYRGLENVIAFTAWIKLSDFYNGVQLEIPTGYLTYEFNDFWRYDPQTGELAKAMNKPESTVWSFESYDYLPPILATPDGAYAMGAYSPEPVRYYGINGTSNSNLADRTYKWTIVVREEPALPVTYVYRSFAIVGTLEQVKKSMRELYALEPSDMDPPTGWLDVVNCQEIAGWAWDPKKPNQSISVDLFELNQDGSRTFLASMDAINKRGDLVSALGDNGMHGFSFVTPNSLKDGQVHNIQLYAVNSNPELPDRHLFGANGRLQCP